MTRRIALPGILLATLALTSCVDSPAGPIVARPANASIPVPAPPPVPPPPAVNINAASGLYDLTLTIGPACAGIPTAEKTRKYTARLDDDGPERYVVSLTDATFMSQPGCIPLGCNQFRAVEDAGAMRFVLENHEWHGGYITEQTASGGWLVMYGEAAGPRAGASIEAVGTGNVWHCPIPSGFPFPSPCGGPASLTPSISCASDLRLAFTKK